ncbi:hypothetical protein GW17_00040101 [Ensete ventricosum]|nr:hypothetical protein GW17_00040101 [Ensete ventricosum]
MAMEEQRDTKNAALIPSVRILADSKLGGDHIGDRPPWNSIGVPSSKLLLKGYRKYSSIDDKKWRIIRLFIGLLTLIPKRNPTSRLILSINSKSNSKCISKSNFQPAHLGVAGCLLFHISTIT